MGHGSTFHFTVRCGAARVPESLAADIREAVVPGGLVDGPRRPADDGAPLVILLAEDNVVNQKLIARLLEKRGDQAIVVANGRAAVDATATRAFDLVLMDVQMPEMDGMEATAAIRRRERETGRHVPIIALTAHAMHGDRERCLAAGMDGYLSKPVQGSELSAVLDRVRTQPRASGPTPMPATEATRTGSGCFAPEDGQPATALEVRRLG